MQVQQFLIILNIGIFTREGYFLNLTSLEWEKRAPLPFRSIGDLVNSMYTFRGLPTVVGHHNCDDDGNCPLDKVIQYRPIEDEWQV